MVRGAIHVSDDRHALHTHADGVRLGHAHVWRRAHSLRVNQEPTNTCPEPPQPTSASECATLMVGTECETSAV